MFVDEFVDFWIVVRKREGRRVLMFIIFATRRKGANRI